MTDSLAAARAAAEELRRRSGCEAFDVAVVLGSGWKDSVTGLGTSVLDLAVSEVPGFLPASVAGHEGRIQVFERGGQLTLAFLGRVHLYEGRGIEVVVHGVRTAVVAGCRAVVLTNAAGAVNPELEVGAPVLISDHISLTGVSPLVGPQFVDLTDLYARRLRVLAREIDPELREGVYAHWPGPAYETPAEIRMLRTLGADLVGMSTVWEAIAARHLGAEVLALSLVTNLAAGLSGAPLDHEEVLEAGRRSAERMGGLLAEVVDRL